MRWDLRQSPDPLHCSAARRIPRASENLSTVLNSTHRLVGLVAQTCVHRRRIGDLAWVEDSRGVPGPFDRAKESIVLLADHQRKKLAPQTAVAVFAAERAAEALRQVRDLGADNAKEPLMLLKP